MLLGSCSNVLRIQKLRCSAIADHLPSRVDRARGSEALYTRGDVHGLAKIILTIVEYDRQARALMNADFENEIVSQVIDRFAHAQSCLHSTIGRRKRSHDRVSYRLYDGTALLGDDIDEQVEVRTYNVEGGEITDSIV